MTSIDYTQAINELVQWYDAQPDTVSFYHFREQDDFKARSLELLPDAVQVWNDDTSTILLADHPERLVKWRAWHDARPGAADPSHAGQILDAILAAHTKPYWIEYDRENPNDKGMKHPGLPPADLEGRLTLSVGCEGPDFGSRTQILEDRWISFPGGDAESYAREYARTVLPIGWRDAIGIFLRSGKTIVVVRWTPNREHIEDTRAWANTQRKHVGGEWQPLWRVLEEFQGKGYEHVPIPPAAPILTVRDILAKAPEGATGRIPTGITALDRVIGGGVPRRGARCYVQGPTGNCKTTLVLAVAANYAARGLKVAWIATRDELPESICVRLRQRDGIPRAEAEAMPFAAEHLNECFHIIDGRVVDLEAVYETGHYDVVCGDPIQKIRTRAGADAGQLESIASALKVIEASGVTTWMTSALVRGSERRAPIGSSYGGGGIENGVTLMLDVRRTGDALAATVLKSRSGGEDATIDLVVDRDRQRILAPDEGVDAVEDRIRADVLAAVATGPKSARTIAEREVTGTAKVIRAVVKAMVAEGVLVERDGLIGSP